MRAVNVKIQSEPHGDVGSQAEMTWPASCRRRVTILPKVAKFLVG
jgi:hypothetical protein